MRRRISDTFDGDIARASSQCLSPSQHESSSRVSQPPKPSAITLLAGVRDRFSRGHNSASAAFGTVGTVEGCRAYDARYNVLLVVSPPDTRSEEEVDHLMEQFHAYLGKKQLKSTRQRDLIARTFFEWIDHITIEDLLERTRQLNPKVGYATVYRTLKLLTECGLAASRKFGDGSAVFETAGDSAHHDHLICLECNHVLEFENDEIERLQEQVARSFGFSLTSHRLDLFGMCPKARGIKGGSCPRDEADAKRQAAAKASERE